MVRNAVRYSTALCWSVQHTRVGAESTQQRLQFPWKVKLRKKFPDTASPESAQIQGMNNDVSVSLHSKKQSSSVRVLCMELEVTGAVSPTHPFAVVQSTAISELFDQLHIEIRLNRDEPSNFLRMASSEIHTPLSLNIFTQSEQNLQNPIYRVSQEDQRQFPK